MIGYIVLAIAAILITFAMINTAVYATIASFFTSIAAIFTGAATGAANLLTAWFYWAAVPTNYAGLAWLAFWVILLVYAGFEIATSDKGWRNAVGKGSSYIGLALCIFLIAQPIAVSYATTYASDATQFSLVDYNVQEQTATVPWTRVYNATNNLAEVQVPTYNNETQTVICSSLAFDPIGSQTKAAIQQFLNTTFLSTEYVTRVTWSWFYVGTGNITKMYITKGVSPFTVLWTTVDTPTYNPPTNGTVTWNLESFESNLLKSLTKIEMNLWFEDATHLPSTGDYIEMSFKFYVANTVVSQELLTQYLAWAFAAINAVVLLYTTKVYRYFM